MTQTVKRTDKQTRTLNKDQAQFRAETVEGKKRLKGYAVLFETPTVLWGEWKEVIDKKAFEGTDLSGLVLLVEHQSALLLAKAGINLKAQVDEIGLYIEADLPNTTLANDTWELVSAGILDGMSFAFYADRWKTDSDRKIDRVLHFKEVWEVTITVFPAYPQAIVIADDGNQQPETAGNADLLTQIITAM